MTGWRTTSVVHRQSTQLFQQLLNKESTKIAEGKIYVAFNEIYWPRVPIATMELFAGWALLSDMRSVLREYKSVNQRARTFSLVWTCALALVGC